MATRVRDRKPSPIQYIETMRQLIIHTDFYMAKLPKALTFTKRVPISQMLMEAANCLISANGIKAICKEDWLKRRKLRKMWKMAEEGLIPFADLDMVFRTTYGNFSNFDANKTKLGYLGLMNDLMKGSNYVYLRETI